MFNLGKILGFTAAGMGKKAYKIGGQVADGAGKYVINTRTFVEKSVGVTLVPLLVGLVLGRIGYGLEAGWLEATGQALICFSAVAAAITLTYAYLRVVMITEGIVGLSGAMNAITFRFPNLKQAQAERFLAFIRGYTVWIMVVGLFGMIVPIHRSLFLAAIITVSFLIIAGYMSANWSEPGKYRKWVLTLVMTVMAVATAHLLFPKAMHQMKVQVHAKLASVSLMSERDAGIDKIRNGARKATIQADLAILNDLYAKKTALEKKAATERDGDFWSQAEAKQYADLLKRIETVKQGLHYKQRAGIKERSLWQRTKDLVSSDDDSNSPSPTTPTAPPTPSGNEPTVGLSAVAPPPAPIGHRPPAPQPPAGSATLAPPSDPAGYTSPKPATRPIRQTHRIPTPKKVENDSYSRMLAELEKEYGGTNEIR